VRDDQIFHIQVPLAVLGVFLQIQEVGAVRSQHRPDVGGYCTEPRTVVVRAHGLVVAERLQRQREQGGFLFGEHGGYLPFGGAVNPCIGPALLPVVQVDLSLLQTFEALSLQRRFLGMTDTGLDLPLAVRMVHAAGQCGRTVVRQHVPIERIERWIVEVGFEYTLAQIIQDDQNLSGCGSTVQFR
jgi:hypothetical protein